MFIIYQLLPISLKGTSYQHYVHFFLQGNVDIDQQMNFEAMS